MTMLSRNRRAFALLATVLLWCGPSAARTPLAPAEAPEVRFDRVQGVVVQSDPVARRLVLRMPGGRTQAVVLAPTVGVESLRNLDDRDRLPVSPGLEALRPGAWIAAAGLVYDDAPELVAGQVSVFGHERTGLVFEQSDWWSAQAREVADFWIRTQLGPDGRGDASGYRTRVNKSGGKRSDTDNLQETDTLSRLIYGLSSAYLMNGDAHVLEAATRFVRWQRERMRIVSADGRRVHWVHALRDGRPVLASRFAEDEGSIPLYEQIYAIAGLTQYFRVTGDPEVLSDIEKSVAFMDAHFWDAAPSDPLARGYFSHVHPGTLRTEDAGARNAARKNWNSVGDHLPAYLENLYLGTREPRHLARMTELGHLIAKHFPDPANPFVRERFDARWRPDTTYAWQQDRAVIGHNLKIAWCLTRLHDLTGERGFLDVAREAADRMLVLGQDPRRGGWYDVIERQPDPRTGRHALTWHDRKAWWQQEQGILANYVLFSATGEPRFLASARAGAGFFNLAFLDRDDGEVFFDVQGDGTPYLIGDRADKGSHSKSGYHILELDLFAHLYTNLLVHARPVALHYAPGPAPAARTFHVQPVSLPSGRVRIASVSYDGQPLRDFDPAAMTVTLPPSSRPATLVVTFTPVPR